MKFFWKLWLRLNLLTEDIDSDYIAPDLPAGQYTLRVVARFTGGSSLLKESRVPAVSDSVLIWCETPARAGGRHPLAHTGDARSPEWVSPAGTNEMFNF